MKKNRRVFIRNLVVGIGLASFYPAAYSMAKGCAVPHPIMPPNKKFAGQCNNCGMQRPMWARTWHTFELAGQKKEVCSIHCLSEMSINSSIEPEKVMVAQYLAPEKMMPADKAVYVVGSKARGTMTVTSKLAFASKEEATAFSAECGGKPHPYAETFQLAAKSLGKDNMMIQQKRVKKGKIVEPLESDVCPVCGMKVAKFPKNKCQIQTKDGKTVHFCATQCLFEFVKNHAKYKVDKVEAKFIWVVDFDSQQWIYARNSYYVVGASQSGPMGKEAFPFINLAKAKEFTKQNGGKVLRFENVNIDSILL